MRRTHFFARSNLVFARDAGDVWALYRLVGRSYPGLSVRRKIELKEELESFAYSVEADFQLLRVARPWSADEYADRVLATADPRHGHREEFEAYVDEQREALARRGIGSPRALPRRQARRRGDRPRGAGRSMAEALGGRRALRR